MESFPTNYSFIHTFILFQKCFTDRGWQRGKLVFLDLLALQFPNHNHCNVFLQLNNSASEVPQKLPNERCSIVEEVSLLTEIRLCNNEAQVSYTIGLNPQFYIVSLWKMNFSVWAVWAAWAVRKKSEFEVF